MLHANVCVFVSVSVCVCVCVCVCLCMCVYVFWGYFVSSRQFEIYDLFWLLLGHK